MLAPSTDQTEIDGSQDYRLLPVVPIFSSTWIEQVLRSGAIIGSVTSMAPTPKADLYMDGTGTFTEPSSMAPTPKLISTWMEQVLSWSHLKCMEQGQSIAPT